MARGLKTAHDLTLSAARKGRFSRSDARAIDTRLSGATDYSGFRHAQLTIEAVFEDVAVKRSVIGELEAILPPDSVIASNTSSLPIASLAAGANRPERIVGMHFFSPVHKMSPVAGSVEFRVAIAAEPPCLPGAVKRAASLRPSGARI